MSAPTFADAVLSWFDRHGRKDLPWQQDPSPYRVWVSEVMLQQTRVETVIPYFHRFLARLPDIPSLAAAAEDEVLALWSGLGYYARARNLRRAAGLICERHGGEMPAAIEAVSALPGIGRSTAGAILSLSSLGQRHPILDGNVKRLLARCFAVPGWAGEALVQKRLWTLAAALLPETRPGPYNQALMDLGALICTRSRPACDRCPLQSRCAALAEGDPSRYPAPRPRRVLPEREVQMLVILDPGGRVLLQRRPPTGVWGGLWSLPECPAGEDPVAWCAQRLGLVTERLAGPPPRRHAFSHFRLRLRPVVLRPMPANGRSPLTEVRESSGDGWYDGASWPDLGLPAPVLRLLEEVCRQPATGAD
jgi:A/G-specific adenine glycosylase